VVPHIFLSPSFSLTRPYIPPLDFRMELTRSVFFLFPFFSSWTGDQREVGTYLSPLSTLWILFPGPDTFPLPRFSPLFFFWGELGTGPGRLPFFLFLSPEERGPGWSCRPFPFFVDVDEAGRRSGTSSTSLTFAKLGITSRRLSSLFMCMRDVMHEIVAYSSFFSLARARGDEQAFSRPPSPSAPSLPDA